MPEDTVNDAEEVCDTKLTQRRSPPARPPRGASLVYIHPTGPHLGARHVLGDGPVYIGRADACEVRLDDQYVSRRHARVEPADGGHAVRDLGSANGTFVNDAPVTDAVQPLRDGDYLRIGHCTYRYLAGGNVEAEYHEELYQLAVRDPLTRLPNRRALDEFLARELVRSHRHARPLSVLLLDLDRFKAVNDTHGHLCGDAVLRALADRLRTLVRAEDLCARYGGEEFTVALVETAHADALATAERLRAVVAGQPFRFEALELRLTLSVGVATTDGGLPIEARELLRTADERLYRAKMGGRDRVAGDTELTAPTACAWPRDEIETLV